MDEEIKKLLEENLKISKEILKLTRRLYHNLVWQRVKFFLKIVILVALIFGAVKFLPPLIDRLITPYKGLFEGAIQQLEEFKKIRERARELEKISPEEIKKFLE